MNQINEKQEEVNRKTESLARDYYNQFVPEGAQLAQEQQEQIMDKFREQAKLTIEKEQRDKELIEKQEKEAEAMRKLTANIVNIADKNISEASKEIQVLDKKAAEKEKNIDIVSKKLDELNAMLDTNSGIQNTNINGKGK